MKKIPLFLVFIPIIFFFNCSNNDPSTYRELVEIEKEPEGRFLRDYPDDQKEMKVNPPGFTWMKNDDASNYDFVVFKGEEIYFNKKKINQCVAVLEEPLPPDTYSWMVTYNDSLGNAFGRSKIRTFYIKEGLLALPMPDVSKLTEELKGTGTRLFLTSEVLGELRDAYTDKGIEYFELCRTLADSALAQSPPTEPAPYKDSVFEVSEWRRIYRPAKSGSANMVRMALIWKITDEKKYLKGAIDWLMNFSGWDPDGITSFRVPQASGFVGNTEASMPLLERMSMVYDWVRDELTTEEKQVILGSIQARGNQMLNRYQDLRFMSEPWDNHTVRSLAFTGLAGLATLGDLQDAEKWLEYVIKCYLTSFPTWGGDDGGWSQGLAYSSTYNLYQTNFVEALSLCTDINMYNKPFFRNNGYFGLYCHPPYAERGGFGDGGDDNHSPKDIILTKRYAQAYKDPFLLWHAEHIQKNKTKKNPNASLFSKGHLWQGYYMEDVVSILTVSSQNLNPISPETLPPSRHFEDIGWVAMHSALGNAEKDVWMLFKSSPYGSFSHSHADQNSFQLNAYGESLIIDSGYYPWYGSPHQQLWSRQTKAHNAILINGRGQSTHSMEASGTIDRYEYCDGLTIVSGECAEAYNLPMREDVIEKWEEYLNEPVPEMDPEAQSVYRTVVFNHDENQPWIIIQDYMKAKSPTHFDYMLHSLEKMEIKKENQQLVIQKGKAVVDVYLLSSEALDFNQTNQFTVDPDESDAGKPNQWHFSASNTEKVDELHFLTLMIPRTSNAAQATVISLQQDNINGFQVGESKILSWSGKGEKGKFSIDGKEVSDIRMVINRKNEETKRIE